VTALGIAFGVLLGLVFVLPLLVPLPPLRGTVPPEELADPEGRFAEVGGVRVHFKVAGDGDPGFVLLHGFGASTFSWREVLVPLGERGTAVAFDRPGFGLTERPRRWTGINPYSPEAQVALTLGIMDELGLRKAVLVGHSAGAGVAVATALAHPERVVALVLVAPAVGMGSAFPPWLRALLATPQGRRIGPLFVRRIAAQGEEILRRSWHDGSRITPEVVAGYRLPLRAQDWDRALWEVTLAARPVPLLDRLPELSIPVLVITGEEDRLIPSEASRRLAARIPGAELVLLPACGHLPHEERPAEFLAAVRSFLDRHGLRPWGREEDRP